MQHVQTVEFIRNSIKNWVNTQCWDGLSEKEMRNRIFDFITQSIITDLSDRELADVITSIVKDIMKDRQDAKNSLPEDMTIGERIFISDFAADTFKILLKESMKENILSNNLYERLSKEAYEAAKVFHRVRKENLKDAV